MAQVTIEINGREYVVACGDGEEAHIIELSRVLDGKAKLLTQNGAQINENQLLAMVGLLVADELQDAKKGMATPEVKIETVEKIVEVPVEKIVEKVVEVPVEKIVEKTVEVPVEKVVEVEKIVEVPVEKIVEKEVSKEADLAAVDDEISTAIKEFTSQINLLASDIQKW